MPSNKEIIANQVISFTQELVKVPSQAHRDRYEPITETLGNWLTQNGLQWEVLKDRSKSSVGILITVDSGQPGPTMCLDAPIDTAPVGDVQDWKYPPFAAEIHNGWLYGRGAADCKVAASIFCHVARELDRSAAVKRGTLYVLLDADEHTGTFGGIKTIIEDQQKHLEFVAVGYPGNYGVVAGARGFCRVRIQTFGKEGHSGSKSGTSAQNPIVKLAQLVTRLADAQLPVERDPEFLFGPRLSLTQVKSGLGFSQIPGIAEMNVDIRLTPGFMRKEAYSLIEQVVKSIDSDMPTEKQSVIEEVDSWPPYRIGNDCKPAKILLDCAQYQTGRSLDFVVCGPSNIGNYLAAHSIPATCGFGVTYRNKHAPDECIELNSVPMVYRTYLSTAAEWFASKGVRLEAKRTESGGTSTNPKFL